MTSTSAISIRQSAGRLLLEIDRDQDGIIARWDGERFTVELDPGRATEFLRACATAIDRLEPNHTGTVISTPRRNIEVSDRLAELLDADVFMLQRRHTTDESRVYDLRRVTSA